MARSSQQRLALEMQDGMRVEVSGLTEALRALSQAGADSEDMRALMHSTGEIVARSARRIAPTRSGALERSIRAGRGKTKAVVRAGTARLVPYAGVIHYGYPARNIAPSMYMVRGLQQTQGEAVTHIEQGITDLLRKNKLI